MNECLTHIVSGDTARLTKVGHCAHVLQRGIFASLTTSRRRTGLRTKSTYFHHAAFGHGSADGDDDRNEATQPE